MTSYTILGVIDIFKDIKKQAKDIIAKNKVLFILSIIFVMLGSVVTATKPLWIDYCTKSTAFVITELYGIILFPLHIGYIKILLQAKDGHQFKISEVISFYKSPQLLFKSIGLIMITNEFMIIANFVNTNFIKEFLKIHNLAFISMFISFSLFIIGALIYLYLFLTNYLFILKPELNLIQIIRQSITFMKGKVMDLIWLSCSFILWFIPLGVILVLIVGLKIKLSPQYFIYYGLFYLYFGCITLYVALTFLLFSQKIINGEDYVSLPLESRIQSYHDKIQAHYFDSSGLEDESNIDDYTDETLEHKRIQFEDNQKLESESISITDTTENLKSYNIELKYDTFEMYYFFKEYGKIRKLFVKTYNEVAYYYDSYNLENTAENTILLNNNNFRLVYQLTKTVVITIMR